MVIQVYFHEFSMPMGDGAYFLPMSSGMLKAYALGSNTVCREVDFKPFIFKRDCVHALLDTYDAPDVLAFSTYTWNEQLNLALAKRLKETYPDAWIVFGGPQVDIELYQKEYAFIDILVKGEGEIPFTEILHDRIAGNDPKSLYPEQEQLDLSQINCPVLIGLFDPLLETTDTFHLVLETNRGCPYQCAYCYWGGARAKLRQFDLGRVKQVIEWCGKNKIRYIFCSDANFGILLERDLEIANYASKIKKTYGYPEGFAVACAKTANFHVKEIGLALYHGGLTKGVSMSRQSYSPTVLDSIGRQNSSIQLYDRLSKEYAMAGIPSYNEIIVGLPNETYHSFVSGIDKILEVSLKTLLVGYLCQMLPNTRLSTSDYRKQYGIKTSRIPFILPHTKIEPNAIEEYENIVVGTNTMTTVEWMNATKVMWMFLILQGLRLGVYILEYLQRRAFVRLSCFVERLLASDGYLLRKGVSQMDTTLDRIITGTGPRCGLSPFGDIVWPQEEAVYLTFINDKAQLFRELKKFALEQFQNCNHKELTDVIAFQRALTPSFPVGEPTTLELDYDLPTFFAGGDLKKKKTVLQIDKSDFQVHTRDDFARRLVLAGKRSDRMLYGYHTKA